jgi:hypothetical protein
MPQPRATLQRILTTYAPVGGNERLPIARSKTAQDADERVPGRRRCVDLAERPRHHQHERSRRRHGLSRVPVVKREQPFEQLREHARGERRQRFAAARADEGDLSVRAEDHAFGTEMRLAQAAEGTARLGVCRRNHQRNRILGRQQPAAAQKIGVGQVHRPLSLYGL